MASPFLTISSLEHVGVEDPVGGRFEIYHLCYYFPKRLGDRHLQADTVRILELKIDAAAESTVPLVEIRRIKNCKT